MWCFAAGLSVKGGCVQPAGAAQGGACVATATNTIVAEKCIIFMRAAIASTPTFQSGRTENFSQPPPPLPPRQPQLSLNHNRTQRKLMALPCILSICAHNSFARRACLMTVFAALFVVLTAILHSASAKF
jgi:hypothetical protein